jgi:predicted P-loop ATPase
MTSQGQQVIDYRYYQQVINDARFLGLDFRINDLDNSIQVKYADEWQRLDDILSAVIQTDLRELGYGRKGKNKGAIGPAMLALVKLANEQRFNPIKDYFKSLEGKYKPMAEGPYVTRSFARFFKNPDGMFSTWLFKWMVGAIAKAHLGERNPMLVLVGPQGTGKSWFARYLCPVDPNYHFIEMPIKPDNKDDLLRLTDVLVWEVAELGATTRRADVESLKAFITQRNVRVRPPHGRTTIEKPVLCSFIGSVNDDKAGFLNDPTGSTRFLACDVKGIDYEYSKIRVELLWAEAYWFYRNVPDSWKLTAEEKLAQQAINAKYEQVSELDDLLSAAFEFSLSADDFMTTLEIRNHLTTFGYSASSGNGFYKELTRLLGKRGVEGGRAKYKPGEPHRHGFCGLKKLGSVSLNDEQKELI